MTQRAFSRKTGARYLKKGNGQRSQRNSVEYAWMKAHQAEFEVKLMCKLLRVSRSAFYAFFHAEPSKRATEDEELVLQIQTIFKESRSTYGTRRIQMALFKQGWSISRRRIGKLMKQEQLSSKTKKKFKLTTDSKHGLTVVPNLWKTTI